jgi:hypothetical protein
MNRLPSFVIAMVTAAGCNYSVHGDANVSVDGQFRFVLGDMDGVCGGSGTEPDDHGVTVWTETPVEAGCRVDIEWNGTLVDMPFVRGEIEANLEDGLTIDKVTLKTITLRFVDLRMDDASGLDVTPPDLASLAADVELDGMPLVSLDESAIVSLLDAPLEIELSAEAVAAADALLHAENPGPVEAHAVGHIVIPLSALPPLDAADGPGVAFGLEIDVGAEVEKEVF